MRAKFLCNSVEKKESAPEKYYENIILSAVYSPDNNAEDNQFSEATPAGSVIITITNEKALGFFKQGNKYYLDFNEATQ